MSDEGRPFGTDLTTMPFGRGARFRRGALDETFLAAEILDLIDRANPPGVPTVLIHVSLRHYQEILSDLAGLRERLEDMCLRSGRPARVIVEPTRGEDAEPRVNLLDAPSSGYGPTVLGTAPVAPGAAGSPAAAAGSGRSAGAGAGPFPAPGVLALDYPRGRIVVPVKGLVLGRTAPGLGRICDRRLSRRHCLVEAVVPGVLTCTDLRSRNGSRRNGVLLTAPATLWPGDVLSVGDTALTVVLSDGRDQGA